MAQVCSHAMRVSFNLCPPFVSFQLAEINTSMSSGMPELAKPHPAGQVSFQRKSCFNPPHNLNLQHDSHERLLCVLLLLLYEQPGEAFCVQLIQKKIEQRYEPHQKQVRFFFVQNEGYASKGKE